MNDTIKSKISIIKPFIKDFIINAFAFGVYIIAQHIVLMPIMAKILPQEIYANYIIYISIFTLISNVLGSELGIVRQAKTDENEGNGKDYNRILLNLIPIIIILSIVSLLFLKYNILDIIFLTMSILLANIRLYATACFRLKKDFKKVLMQNTIYFFGLILGLIIYIRCPYIWIPTLIAEILSNVYSIIKTNIIKEGLAKKANSDIIKTFINFGFISLLVNGITYFDKILIYPILGGVAVALYYSTTSMSKVISLILNPVHSVILSWLKGNDEKIKNKIVSLILKINIPIVITSFIISVPLTYITLKILYPQYWADAIKLIIPVCIALSFSTVTSLVKAILLKYIDSKKLVKAYVSYFVVFILGAIVMSKYMGIIGFAYSNVIAQFCLWIAFLLLLKKCIVKKRGIINEEK